MSRVAVDEGVAGRAHGEQSHRRVDELLDDPFAVDLVGRAQRNLGQVAEDVEVRQGDARGALQPAAPVGGEGVDGAGIALVPAVSVARDVDDGRLVAVTARGAPSRRVRLVGRRGQPQSPAAQALAQMMRQDLAGLRL